MQNRLKVLLLHFLLGKARRLGCDGDEPKVVTRDWNLTVREHGSVVDNSNGFLHRGNTENSLSARDGLLDEDISLSVRDITALQ